MISLLLWIFVLLCCALFFGSAGYAALRAAPWLPTRRRDFGRLFKLAAIKPGELVVDLGCGDGRLVLTAAEQYKARAVGIELSFIPFLVSLFRAKLSPARDSLRIRFSDFFAVSLREADVVVCFLTPEAMKKLKTKFVQELKPGARIVSYAFALHGWPNGHKDKPNPKAIPIFLYQQGVGNRMLTESVSMVE